jgi:hypothetical protein
MGTKAENSTVGTRAGAWVKGDQRITCANSEKIAADTARYEALAREHSADLSEEGFNEVLRKVGSSRGQAALVKRTKKV